MKPTTAALKALVKKDLGKDLLPHDKDALKAFVDENIKGVDLEDSPVKRGVIGMFIGGPIPHEARSAYHDFVTEQVKTRGFATVIECHNHMICGNDIPELPQTKRR